VPFLKKKKISIRVIDSEWSDSFSLVRLPSDEGKLGKVVRCKSSDGTFQYQVGVTVELCDDGLTKQVFIAPYYILSNLAPFNMEARVVCEDNELATQYSWIAVDANKSVPLWPLGNEDYVIFRVSNTTQQTPTISLKSRGLNGTLLRLDNRHGGIFVDFKVSELSLTVTCRGFEEGLAPLVLINSTLHSLLFIESSNECTTTELPAQTGVYYTWKQPNGNRKLKWSINNQVKQNEFIDVVQDGCGCLRIELHNIFQNLYWKCFKFGQQYVLLFKSQAFSLNLTKQLVSNNQIDTRIVMELSGLGLSFVDNVKRYEICYLGIRSPPPIWEKAKESKKKLYVTVNKKQQTLLEQAYQQYLLLKKVNENMYYGRQEFEVGKLLVDFDKMIMYRPKKRFIRRSCSSAIEIEYLMDSSQRSRTMRARFSNIQIDNKLHHCYYPVVLVPSLLPRRLCILKKNNKMKDFFGSVQMKWSKSVIDFVSFQIKPFDLCLDYNYFLEMWNLLFMNDGINNHKNLYSEMKSALRGYKNKIVKLFQL